MGELVNLAKALANRIGKKSAKAIAMYGEQRFPGEVTKELADDIVAARQRMAPRAETNAIEDHLTQVSYPQYRPSGSPREWPEKNSYVENLEDFISGKSYGMDVNSVHPGMVKDLAEESPDAISDWVRIAALGGVAAGGGAMMADEADASPIGKMMSKAAAKKAGSFIESSAAKLLKGTPFRDKVITNVTKGHHNWRYIHLDDDTVYPVTKDVLHDMSRKVGTDRKLAEFGAKDEPSQLVQALKSLDYHRARSIPAGSKLMMKEYYKQWSAQLKEAGLPAVESCMVRSGKDVFLMPTNYAELLEREGHLKILKRLSNGK